MEVHNLISEVEVNSGVGVLESPLVGREARALADGEEGGVLSSGPGFFLALLGLNGELDRVVSGLNGLDDFAVTEWFSVARWVNFDVDLTSSGFVEDGEVKSEGEGGSESSVLGGNGGAVDDNISDTVGAGSEFLADEDGVWVDGVEELDEFVNSDNVAKNVANAGFNGVGQKAAKSIARSDDSSVGNDFNEFLESFVHEFNAWLAQVDVGAGSTLLDLSLLDLEGGVNESGGEHAETEENNEGELHLVMV